MLMEVGIAVVLTVVAGLFALYMYRVRQPYEQRILLISRVSDNTINFALRPNARGALAWFCFGPKTPRISAAEHPEQPHPFSIVARTHPEDRERVNAAKWRAVQMQTETDILCRVATLDRGFRWVRIAASPWFRSPSLQAWTGEIYDVTELVEARMSASVNGNLIENIFDMYFEVDSEKRILSSSSKLPEATGRLLTEYVSCAQLQEVFHAATASIQSAECFFQGKRAKLFISRPTVGFVSGRAAFVAVKLADADANECLPEVTGDLLQLLIKFWDVNEGVRATVELIRDPSLDEQVRKGDWTRSFRILEQKNLNFFSPSWSLKDRALGGDVAGHLFELLCFMSVRATESETAVNLLLQAITLVPNTTQPGNMSCKSMLVAFYVLAILKLDYPDLATAQHIYSNHATLLTQAVATGRCDRGLTLKHLGAISLCWAKVQRKVGRNAAALVTESSAFKCLNTDNPFTLFP